MITNADNDGYVNMTRHNDDNQPNVIGVNVPRAARFLDAGGYSSNGMPPQSGVDANAGSKAESTTARSNNEHRITAFVIVATAGIGTSANNG